MTTRVRGAQALLRLLFLLSGLGVLLIFAGQSAPAQATAGHDAQLRRIQTSFSVLGGVFDAGTPDEREIFVQVRNESTHAAPETIGVYIDVITPGGQFTQSTAVSADNPFGCAPAGRILDGVITLNQRGTTGDTGNIFADTHTPNLAGSTVGSVGSVDFFCTNQAGAVGQRYKIIAAVDHGDDDLADCGPGDILTLACNNALVAGAPDDNDTSDNRDELIAPRVKKPQVE